MDTRDLVINALARELRRTPQDVIDAGSLDALGIESLDMVSVIMSLEDALRIHISDRDLHSVKSLDDLVALVERAQAGDVAAN